MENHKTGSLALAALVLAATGSTSSFGQNFEDISITAGITDPHNGTYFGVGQAWLDIERDGDLDLFVSNHNGPNHLYVNQGDQTFTQPPEFNNLAMPDDQCNGVAIGDYDNDGWQDIYVACDGPNRLFRNLGGAAFEEVGLAAGVADSNDGQVAAWADVNNDSFIDLYLVNYLEAGIPESSSRSGTTPRDAFYINQGDGTFIDMGAELDASELEKPGLAATFLDFDFDGDLDLYVVNDRVTGNTLWRNDGPGTPQCPMTWCFTDVSIATNANRPVNGMGIAVADYDLDGDEDLYFSSIGEQVLLASQLAQGSASYQERSIESGLSYDAVGWATLFLDVENDSWPDAYLATWGTQSGNADEFYINQRNGTFLAVGASSGIRTLTSSEGAAMGDFDNDGLMDILVTDPGTQCFLYRNITTSSNNWLSVVLEGAGPVNRDGLGAVVRIHASDDRVHRRTLVSGGSRGAGNELRLHFGLGTATVDHAVVIWPNGRQQVFSPTLNAITSVAYEPTEMLHRSSFE
ncbi:MAG: CRTAC1 family protein [Xanthomonadales bacterium]|nr:CRTAC1 family protein [Xanthomonadales bacterium]